MNRIIGIAVLLAAAGTALAQTRNTNLSGTWRLNVAASNMGQEHPFNDYLFTKTIAQTREYITITETAIHNSTVNVPLPDSENSVKIVTDGKQHDVQFSSLKPNKTTSVNKVTATWQGNTLELIQLISGLGNMTKQRLFLSEDGSHLIELVEGHNVYGDLEQRLVFDKVQ